MSRTLTVQNMIDAVTSKADIVSDDNISTTDLIRWIDEGYAELCEILISSGMPFFESEQTIITVSGQNAYPVNGDFYCPLVAYYQQSSDLLVPLREINPRALHRVSFSGSQAGWYRMVVNNLVLYPTPPAGQTYLLKYVPTPVRLTATNQTIDGVAGWESYIETFATIEAKDKQDRPTDVQERRLQRLAARIVAAASNRALASATSLYDESGMGDYERDPAEWRRY